MKLYHYMSGPEATGREGSPEATTDEVGEGMPSSRPGA